MKQLRQSEALAVLKRGHDAVAGLTAALPSSVALRSGLGGGDWSVKDLLGHLTSWEEYALAALDAWTEGKTAPIDRALRTDGLDAVNLAAVGAKAARPYDRVLADFDMVHRRLLARIADLSETDWSLPPTARSRRSLGSKLGSLLIGASGGFGHADSHLADLRALVAKTDAAKPARPPRP